jgi:hypothetical protein
MPIRSKVRWIILIAASIVASCGGASDDGMRTDSELQPGDCWNSVAGEEGQSLFQVVECTEPHEAEVFLVPMPRDLQDPGPVAAYLGVAEEDLPRYLAEAGLTALCNFDVTTGGHCYLKATSGLLDGPVGE